MIYIYSIYSIIEISIYIYIHMIHIYCTCMQNLLHIPHQICSKHYFFGRKFLPQVCLICLIHELCFTTDEHCENHKSVLLACNMQNDRGTHECIDINMYIYIYTYTAVWFIMFHLMLLQDFWYPDWKFSHLENR